MRQKKKTTNTSSKLSSNSTQRSIAFSDLVTKSEAALSSQATVYSQRTQIGSQYGTLENDYEFNRQDAGQIFINKQQEHIIQQILQISRKGKINQNNAFQIPLKVMNTQNSQNINAKFWKFASELLNASMIIYDKRVQNVYINIHKMCNKINRINGSNIQIQKDDDAVNHQERIRNAQHNKRAELLNIRIQDYASLSQVDSIEVGANTLEEKQKINIKKLQNQFIADPMFLKTQKMFDSYSLKSLMMNIFNLGDHADVKLFNDKVPKKSIASQQPLQIQHQPCKEEGSSSQKIKQQKMNRNIQETVYVQTSNQNQWHHYQSQMKQKSIDQMVIPYHIMQKHQKIQFISKNQTMFKQIHSFIQNIPELREKQPLQQTFQRQNQREETQQFKSLFNQLQGHFKYQSGDENQHHSFQQQLYQVEHSVHSSPFHFTNQDTLNITNPIQIKSTWSERINNMFQNDNQHSQDSSYFLLSQQNDHNTLMTPWQIQFKNQKLIKKIKKQAIKSKQSKKRSQKSKPEEFVINFDQPDLQRSAVLKPLSDYQINKNKRNKPLEKTQDVNLAPMTYDIYAIYHKKMKSNARNFQRNNSQQPYFDRQNQNINFQNQASSFPFDLNRNNFCKQQEPSIQIFGNQDNHQLDAGSQMPNFESNTQSQFLYGASVGIHSMRGIKKTIYEQLKKRGKLKLSQIELNLSPAQLMISCLHLTNQHNLQLISIDDDQDFVLLLPENN